MKPNVYMYIQQERVCSLKDRLGGGGYILTLFPKGVEKGFQMKFLEKEKFQKCVGEVL